MRKVFGIVNFHNAPEILPITANRPLGSTSFLGRYAFCDFALSNLCNSGISQVGLLVKDHQRSILKHIGNMNSWVINTKLGRQHVLYNEPGHLDPRLNSDVNNLLENDWVLYDSNSEYLVIVPSHLIIKIDLRPYIEEHIREGRQVTMIASQQRNLRSHWKGANVFEFDANGVLLGAEKNVGQYANARPVSLDTIIIHRPTLLDMIRQYSPMNPGIDLFSMIMLGYKEGKFGVHIAYFDGFVRSCESFEGYMSLCLGMLDKKNAEPFFGEDWPIYTLTHDTPPALYGVTSEVQNSYVSNGARVEGKVQNSIIARNVVIGKGAVIKNSIIFSGAKINEGAVVENALVDKYAIIERDHVIKGKGKDPIYVQQGAIL